ncbi:nucleoplasmin-like isoform X2 [Hemicordylus capensis]|uniref:nucleoplasmin-like isoform X2 n=1 Tax=Hemicordylus capensis TaxID=884348 RepID=UPI00230213F4|nr:nucleoplasmin-like isoform X2 [Hemicordylus capensis]
MDLEVSSHSYEITTFEKPLCKMWGCKLDAGNPTFTVDLVKEWLGEQQLCLKTVCLSGSAKEEFHTVELLVPKNGKETAPVHLATLKPSVLPMVSLVGFDMNLPVTFRLKSGCGPVYLSGQYLTDGPYWSEEEDESQEDQEMEASSKDDSPVKLARRPSAKHAAVTKERQEHPQKGTRDRRSQQQEET